MVARGDIRNRECSSQAISFADCCFDKCTASNIDGLLEFRRRGFVYLEYKRTGCRPETGQWWALERACDSHSAPCLFLVAWHSTPIGEVIQGGAARVVEYRWNRALNPHGACAPHTETRPVTVRAAILGFLKAVGLDEQLRDVEPQEWWP